MFLIVLKINSRDKSFKLKKKHYYKYYGSYNFQFIALDPSHYPIIKIIDIRIFDNIQHTSILVYIFMYIVYTAHVIKYCIRRKLIHLG